MAQKDTKTLVNDICPKATSIVGYIASKANVADAPIHEGTIINIEPNPSNTSLARISISDSSNKGLLYTVITDDRLDDVSWEEKVYPSTPYVK